MREIKFRFWNKHENKWMVDGRRETSIYDFAFKDMYWNYLSCAEALEQVVVMQFTGLLDKVGKEIYEGDIFLDKWIEKGKEIKGEVYWNIEKFGWYYRNSRTDCPIDRSIGNMEVIGNIYENPELL